MSRSDSPGRPVGAGRPVSSGRSAHSVIVVGDVLIGRDVEVGAVGGARPDHLARVGAAWLDGPGAAGAAGALDGGARTVLVAHVGDDPEGALCRDRLAAAGCDVTHIGVQSGWATGLQLTCRPVPGACDDPEPLCVTVPSAPRPGAASPPSDRPADRLDVTAILNGCRAGDSLVVDSLSLPHVGDLIEAAYHADLQLIADLRPFPAVGADSAVGRGVDPALLARVDVALVDPEGAGLLAESGALVGSMLALAGRHGASWGGLVRELPQALHAAGARFDRWEALDDRSPWAHHAFCGRLAAELADGQDRPEALEAALATWWRHARSADSAFAGRRLSPPAAWRRRRGDGHPHNAPGRPR